MMHDDSSTTTVRIPLRARDGSLRAHAIADAADAERLNRWRWSLETARSGLRYAVRGMWIGGKTKTRSMHREVLNLPMDSDGREVDHINRDGLDNRRSNLREVTHAGNHQNKRHGIGRTSRYRGVTCRRGTRWIAQATLDGKHQYLGSFDSEIEAARVASAWRAEHMPYAVEGPRPGWPFAELAPTTVRPAELGPLHPAGTTQRQLDLLGATEHLLQTVE